jgi:hypothetical protein
LATDVGCGTLSLHLARSSRHGRLTLSSVSAYITVQTRKRLWARSGNRCAYPGCTLALLTPTAAGNDDTVIGKECHIVAQTDDDPSVARSPCLLTHEEKSEWAHLIEHRHAYENLVLMCGVHSDIIDDPRQQFSVAQVVQIKLAHEQEIEARVGKERAESVRATEGATESEIARPLVLDDVGSWQRKAVVALADDDPEALYWLRSQIGDPPDPERMTGLIARWPETVGGRSDLLAVAVIRHAEAVGLWSQAADGWEHYADRAAENPERADRLVRAAIDAQVAGEHDRRERLLAAAEEADPECARLHLERMDSDLTPAEQLVRLEEIHPDEQALGALIACQKAMTSLLLPDLDAAERYLAQADEFDPNSVANRATTINIQIQRARVAVISDQAFSLADARSARRRTRCHSGKSWSPWAAGRRAAGC